MMMINHFFRRRRAINSIIRCEWWNKNKESVAPGHGCFMAVIADGKTWLMASNWFAFEKMHPKHPKAVLQWGHTAANSTPFWIECKRQICSIVAMFNFHEIITSSSNASENTGSNYVQLILSCFSFENKCQIGKFNKLLTRTETKHTQLTFADCEDSPELQTRPQCCTKTTRQGDGSLG